VESVPPVSPPRRREIGGHGYRNHTVPAQPARARSQRAASRAPGGAGQSAGRRSGFASGRRLAAATPADILARRSSPRCRHGADTPPSGARNPFLSH